MHTVAWKNRRKKKKKKYVSRAARAARRSCGKRCDWLFTVSFARRARGPRGKCCDWMVAIAFCNQQAYVASIRSGPCLWVKGWVHRTHGSIVPAARLSARVLVHKGVTRVIKQLRVQMNLRPLTVSSCFCFVFIFNWIIRPHLSLFMSISLQLTHIFLTLNISLRKAFQFL